MTNTEHSLDRYTSQIRFAPLGEDGQRKLRQGRVLICGCGALGSVAAATLVRAGVGMVRIADRDYVELRNLQRQFLFDEHDAANILPKAVAAANKLRDINSQVEIDPIVIDVAAQSLDRLADDVDLIIDGTDNFETRFLLNDFAVQREMPWIYGGCIGAEGQTMTIIPHDTSCFACLMSDLPPPGSTPTCDTAGILGPVINVVASLEAAEAIKILSGNLDAICRTLRIIDVWSGEMRSVDLRPLAEGSDCRVCQQRRFDWLAGTRGSSTAVLCGRDAVQLQPQMAGAIDLEAKAQQLASLGEVSHNGFLLRFTPGEMQLTLFPDGRAIVAGTEDVSQARSFYAKYVGN